MAGEHRAVAGSPEKFPCVHGDGPVLHGSWVYCALQRCPDKNLKPDQKAQVPYILAGSEKNKM